MRILARAAGMCWRGLLWLVAPPIGWYATVQARKRRRHNAVVRELRHQRRPCLHC